MVGRDWVVVVVMMIWKGAQPLEDHLFLYICVSLPVCV